MKLVIIDVLEKRQIRFIRKFFFLFDPVDFCDAMLRWITCSSRNKAADYNAMVDLIRSMLRKKFVNTVFRKFRCKT